MHAFRIQPLRAHVPDPHSAAPEPPRLDDCIVRAFHGERDAIALLVSHFRPVLLAEVRVVLQPSFASEAEDVLQDFLVELCDRRLRFLFPDRHRVVPWMIGVLRERARKLRQDRERDWGDET